MTMFAYALGGAVVGAVLMAVVALLSVPDDSVREAIVQWYTVFGALLGASAGAALAGLRYWKSVSPGRQGRWLGAASLALLVGLAYGFGWGHYMVHHDCGHVVPNPFGALAEFALGLLVAPVVLVAIFLVVRVSRLMPAVGSLSVGCITIAALSIVGIFVGLVSAFVRGITC